jgi:Spy/CpxP family protein refolding chaperone
MSFAQGGGGGRGMGMKPEDQAKMYQTSLKLTDDQTTKVTAILTVQAAKRDSLMKAANGDMSSMRAAFGPMREATNAKIKALLTDEQKAEFDKMQANMRQRGGGQGGGGGTPPPPPPAPPVK